MIKTLTHRSLSKMGLLLATLGLASSPDTAPKPLNAYFESTNVLLTSDYAGARETASLGPWVFGPRLPQGKPYTNTDDNWEWLCEYASKAARWLGYVAFERIVDERNAAPEVFVADQLSSPEPILSYGSRIELPLSLEQALPEFICSPGFPVRQPYRIIVVGEKTSLGPVLRPIAALVKGEMLLPTGEASDTMVAELAARIAFDGRKAVVLYFSDFDPGGRQMAVSVSHKLQALRDLSYPDLRIQLIRSH